MLSIPAVQPPWTGVGRSIESSVRKALHDFQLIDGCESIAIALSGGKDSLTLLYMLSAMRGRGFPDFAIHAIHVSGAFTCGAGVQSAALRQLCDALGVIYHERETVQTLDTLECYSCSRQRRNILYAIAEENGVSTIAFGHHRDDNAETLVMNLLQKGEFAGMLPKLHMHAYNKTIIRPLIYVGEADIIAFAEQSGFRRIMCRCPVGQNSQRKKVKDMISAMEMHFPYAKTNLAQASLKYGSQKAALRPIPQLA